jgi:solute carrier family 29 (equilibrative nucleoside transporter), member 1/2/3
MFLIVIMLFLLATSPILPLEGGFFFFFVIFNSMIQASAGSYLQTAVAGLGALFGPQILQYAFTGQAAVGVIVSVVQYISLAVSLGGDNFQDGTSAIQNEISKTSLSSSAFIFFGIATGYMILSLAAHALLIRMPAYLAIIKPFEQPREVLGEEEPSDNFLDQSENQPFLSGIIDVQFPRKGNIWEVANMNIVYNIAVAYAFVVTLVSFWIVTPFNATPTALLIIRSQYSHQ